MANNSTGREIIVSKFEVFPDDPVWCNEADIPKTVGEIIINTKDKTVAYRHISGWEPSLFIILTVMGANKNWMRVLSNSEHPDKKHLIITSWKRDYVSEYFLAS